MLSTLTCFYAGLITLALASIPALAQQVHLPDAPKPYTTVSNTSPRIKKSGWSNAVQPGEKSQPLSIKEKLLFPIHEELLPLSWFSTFFSSGWEQLTDSDPRYGVDSGAYGQRLGAAVVRGFNMRVFSDGALPALLHEDPRYYRKAHGSIVHRGLYAALRVFVGQRDSGVSVFNTSVVVGHGMASALTMAYYPDKSSNTAVVFKTWGFSLLGEAGGNLWLEFWPDAHERLFRRHHSDE